MVFSRCVDDFRLGDGDGLLHVCDGIVREDVRVPTGAASEDEGESLNLDPRYAAAIENAFVELLRAVRVNDAGG